ncbi:protein of unknown function [Rhodovastum atsumiense]|uniref:DUF2628 domain-containing protein n=1 Tax=Rhodovastum atsumiense TaxID=504468 RepID=UPI00139F2B46|nr:DUF2628 domain-containing protein [Rhodovastum atsumiense]CAH2600699.1 protein of unknown function [Rhodovastum atsumiense]
MTIWTAYLRQGRPPVLVPETFSWGAALFGPLWLAVHGAWIAAVLALCAGLALGLALPAPAGTLAALALAWFLGLTGQDLRRWSLEQRGWRLAGVVAAPDDDGALARLLEGRPELIAEAVA